MRPAASDYFRRDIKNRSNGRACAEGLGGEIACFGRGRRTGRIRAPRIR